MTRTVRSYLPAIAFAIVMPLAPALSNAATPGFMACVVNRTGNIPRFFYTAVFPRNLEDRNASAGKMEEQIEQASHGRYKLEANCIWHEYRAVVMNKIADIVNDAENANADTYKWAGFIGASE